LIQRAPQTRWSSTIVVVPEPVSMEYSAAGVPEVSDPYQTATSCSEGSVAVRRQE
jgi:hypothetical protein